MTQEKLKAELHALQEEAAKLQEKKRSLRKKLNKILCDERETREKAEFVADKITLMQATRDIAWPKGFSLSCEQLAKHFKAGLLPGFKKSPRHRTWLLKAEFDDFLESGIGRRYHENFDLNELIIVRNGQKFCGNCKTRRIQRRHLVDCHLRRGLVPAAQMTIST